MRKLLATALFEDCSKSLRQNGANVLEPLRNSLLVVTGGSGFVGLWIATCCAYLNDYHNFRIRLLLTARRQKRFIDAVPFLAGRKDLSFVAKDIRQFIELPSEADWIIHAAASPDSREHATNPIETMAVIAEGTHRILRVADKCLKLRMMLHLSSALVYGAQPQDLAAIPEEYVGRVDSASITSAYAEAKRYSETLCASERSQSRIPVAITRPFTFLGPFQPLDAPWAINNFLHAALHGQPLKIQGDGQTVRSYLYGSDMAVLVLKMLTKGQSGGVYNLGNAEGITLESLAGLVVQRAGGALEIRYNTGRQASRSRLVPDMGQVGRLFNFQPAFSLIEAIDRTLAFNSQVAPSVTE